MTFAQDGRNKDDIVDEVKHFKSKHVSPSLRSSFLPYSYNVNPLTDHYLIKRRVSPTKGLKQLSALVHDPLK